jgi:hypothetical protein
MGDETIEGVPLLPREAYFPTGARGQPAPEAAFRALFRHRRESRAWHSICFEAIRS